MKKYDHASLLAAGVKAGASVVAALDVYGATFSLLRSLFESLGVKLRMVNFTDHAEVETALKETGAVVLYFGSISNPLLKVADIPALGGLAHRHGASLLVDNTFASPYLINPFRHGTDFVIHSATKYLSGHGDVLAGVVAETEEAAREALKHIQVEYEVYEPLTDMHLALNEASPQIRETDDDDQNIVGDQRVP